jgi:hypothetical protein
VGLGRQPRPHQRRKSLACLDLVIGVDTAVVHLADGTAKPVRVLIARVPGWRGMLDREDSLWYPSMPLFRRPATGDWTRALVRVVRELRSVVAGVSDRLLPSPIPTVHPTEAPDTQGARAPAMPAGGPVPSRQWMPLPEALALGGQHGRVGADQRHRWETPCARPSGLLASPEAPAKSARAIMSPAFLAFSIGVASLLR